MSVTKTGAGREGLLICILELSGNLDLFLHFSLFFVKKEKIFLCRKSSILSAQGKMNRITIDFEIY